MTTDNKLNRVSGGVKMFADRKAQEKFLEIVNAFEADKAYIQKEAFVEEVKDLFDAKITSEEGEYDEFRITVKDLVAIAETYV